MRVERAGCCLNKHRKLHVAANRCFKPLPIGAQPIPRKLLRIIVIKKKRIPQAQILRLNNIRADKRLKNRFNVSSIFAGAHGSAHIALKVCISGVLVGSHKRAKELVVAIMLHFIFKHKRTNIGTQLQKFGFVSHIHIV